ncbi:hypothetical protein POTOM_029540 [Populus tomentosa]|uniref:Protein kinase domain-containing protein n=1 Tax=Populus tomentosa TaxID=118781 RepID=A0A8X7ZB70_POPTO|nr:hypothetical protein POTOM_029540 [Populus tomentosa]
MGKSTYGTVYKTTLKDGNQVAVKRLREKISKGQKEFENKVDVLCKIGHPNLLAFRDCYLGPKERQILFSTPCLKGFLQHSSIKSINSFTRGPDTPIDWKTRMQIAKTLVSLEIYIGMTRGLFYLHDNENIIHGNLISSNVLLDEHKNAKIADHGLSRLMTAAANMYTALECILELLTGKSPGEPMNGVDLPPRIASIFKEEWTNEVFDLELMKDVSIISDKLLNTLKLALHCGDPSPSTRPEVQQVLSNWKRLDQRQL